MLPFLQPSQPQKLKKHFVFRHIPHLIALILALLGLRANAQTIFHCSQTAGAGDVIGIQGDSFGNTPQVWMQYVTGTETSLVPTQQLTVLSATGSTYGTSTSSYVSALIPANEAPGLYAIWVSSNGGSTFSSSVYINQAAAWNANDLCGSEVDPNRQFHLYGRNLCFSGTGTPTVTFVTGPTSLPATVASGTDPYILAVTSPAGLVSGDNYTLMVNNGFGGTYGTTTGPILSGTVIAGGADVFGLGVPWGADFTTYPKHVYTVPFVSATTDESLAIQDAIWGASSSGGGIVSLQAGTYLITPGTAGKSDDFLVAASNVVIQGAGMNQTTILMSGTSLLNPFGYLFGLSDGGNSTAHFGLSNLTLYNTNTGANSNYSFEHYHVKTFLINTCLKADAGKNLWNGGTQFLCKNCVITNSPGTIVQTGSTSTAWDGGEPVYIQGASDVVFENNLVTYYFCRDRVALQDYGVLVESNTNNRIGINNGWLFESGGFDVSESCNTTIHNNLLEATGTCNLTENNDGETIMNQTGGQKNSYGTVTSASSLALTDTSKDWLTLSGTNFNFGSGAFYMPYSVSIIKGLGAGQMRYIASSSSNTLTLTAPWAVTPAAGSHYAINLIEANQQLVKDNYLDVGVQGIEYYSIDTENTCIVNNTLYNNGAIGIRSTQNSNLFQTQMDTLVAGNSVTTTSSDTYNETYAFANVMLVAMGQSSEGTSIFGTEARNNTVTGPIPNRLSGLSGEGFADVGYGNTIGVIFQNNTAVTCTNAFHICSDDRFTVFWNNTTSNCGSLVLDQGSIETFYGPVITVITAQPRSATVVEGQAATFTAAASGIPTPGYQWQRMPMGSGTWSNMADISGTYAGTATGTLTVSNATPAMSGDQFQCVAGNGYPPSATGSAATLTVETGYNAWASGVFGSQFSNSSVSGPAATPQNDGVPNAAKYLCGINPLTPMSSSSYVALPAVGTTTVSGTSYLTLTYRANPSIPGLTLSVQTCTDMKTWQTVTPNSIQPIGTDPATGDSIIEIKVQNNGGNKMFMRLQIIVS